MAEQQEVPPAEYGDWPNSIGFTTWQEERTPVELEITGRIPDYVDGTLYRIGPAGQSVQTDAGTTHSTAHWFDGFSQMHRFLLTPTRITYNSRILCDTLITSIRTSTAPNNFTFGSPRDPCKSLFRKFLTTFSPQPDMNKDTASPETTVDDVVANVTITPSFPGLPGGEGNLYTKTDANLLQRVNPETLEPEGVAYQTQLHPLLKGPLSASHARRDPVTGDLYNYNLDLSMTGTYRIFHVSPRTQKTRILATISAPAAYIHSFFLTQRYIVLCIFSSHYSFKGISMLWTKNIIGSVGDNTGVEAIWYIIDRENGGVVRRCVGEPFFAFHCVNAWEHGEDVLCDVIAYDNTDVMRKFYYAHIRGDSPEAGSWAGKGCGEVRRYRLDGGRAERVWTMGRPLQGIVGVELPTVNPRFVGRENRYTYALLDRGKSSLLDGIVRFDAKYPGEWGRQKIWEEKGCTPGEVVFIPDPEGEGEEDGVLVSVVFDGRGAGEEGPGSFLLFLEPGTMREVARVGMGGRVVTHGFHGAWVGDVKCET